MSNLEMRPIEVSTLRNYSTNDARQVPAAGATVAIAKQGATVAQAVTCTSTQDATVQVGNCGRLSVGDVVSPNTTGNLLYVKGVASDGLSLTLRTIHPSNGSVSLVVGDRLMCLAPAASATVAQATVCQAQTATEVPLRGPLVADVVHPSGDTARPLTVADVAADGLSVSLLNNLGFDVYLTASTPMLYETGYLLFNVTEATVCPDGQATWVTMRITTLATGTTVYPHADLAKPLVVLGFDDQSRVLELNNANSFNISLIAWERLLARGSVPAWADASGLVALGGNGAMLDSRGVARFHTAETRVDCFVTGGGLTAPVSLPDRLGGWMRGNGSVFNALDYPSIQNAIDALPAAGGTVLIPAGTYDLTETLYLPVDRPCQLVGEGASLEGDHGTVLRWTTNTGMLRVRGDDSSVRGMTLFMQASGVAPSEHEGCGVFIGRRDIRDAHPHPGTDPEVTEYERCPYPLTRVTLEDVTIRTPPGWGVTIPGWAEQSDGAPEHGLVRPDVGRGGGTLSFWITLTRVRVVAARRYGALFTGGGCTTIYLDGSALLHQGAGSTPTQTCYAHLRNTEQVVFRNCTFEGTSPAGDTGDLDGTTRPWIRLIGSNNVNLDTCWFENDPHYDENGQAALYSPQYFLHIAGSSRAISLRHPHLVRAGLNGGLLRCVYCEDGGVTGLRIVAPFAVSASALTEDPNPGVLTDRWACVLGQNDGVVVEAAGTARDLASNQNVPLAYGWIPDTACLMEEWTLRVPVATKDDRAFYQVRTGQFTGSSRLSVGAGA